MRTPPHLDEVAHYTLLDALRNRRSRRFALGMTMPAGPLAYQSRHAPYPLSEEEEALLVFAACGVTGYALGDLPYATGQGRNYSPTRWAGPLPAATPSRPPRSSSPTTRPPTC